MPEFAPTPAQRRAITDRGGALLVSAAAGSGKTRVLTERLMAYLCDAEAPQSLDSFLVITFSKAAAAELRGRIADELARRAAAAPASRRLRRESALVPRAQIGTIHSFCVSLLREHCHLAGLAPDFAVADEDRALALRRMALERTLEAAYERREPDFLLLADTVGAGRDDRRLAELVLRLHERLQSHARPAAWAGAQLRALETPQTDAGETPWGRELLDEARDEAAYRLADLEALRRAMAARPRIEKAYGPSLDVTLEALRAFLAAADRGWEAARAALPIPFPRLSALRDSPDPALSELCKSRRAACHKAMARVAEELGAPSAKLLADMALTTPAMAALLRLALDFDACYGLEKRRRSLVDFADLEHLAAGLLTDEAGAPTPTALALSQRFTEVMVDEYQDVSRVQDLIIRAVSRGGRNLFLVGDVKQSIYRFRLADPGIFLEKYNSYADAEDAAPGAPRRVFLRESFRSRPEVVDAVNAVFENIMSTKLGELAYDENAALRAAAPYAGHVPLPELVLVELPEAEEDEARPDRLACEARCVARRIRALVEGGATVEDRGARRPLGYGDVAILLRAVNVSGGVFRRELQRAGVPVQAGGGTGFFETPELAVLLSLLAVIDNPRQDVPLIAVLRSELFGFTPDELGAVRACRADGDFWDALCQRAQADAKAAAFLDTLAGLRDLARDAELGALLQAVYDRLDCMALCRALPDGLRRRNDLMRLHELARQFEATGWRGLHRFLLWLRSMQARGQEPGLGAAAEGGAVQIMSVHRSKGLEFPVVFLCDTNRRFNRADARESVLVHPVLGLGPKRTDTARGVEWPTLARRAIARRLERETLSEELRLLYVAMTRARERLFLTCAMAAPARVLEKLGEGLASPLPTPALLAMPSPAHWLAAAALADGQRRLRIVLDTPEGAAPPRPESARSETEKDYDNIYYVNIKEALAWRYPHEAAQGLPSKVTATELKSLGEPDGEAGSLLPRAARAFRAPRLGAAPAPDALARGTATHLALRYMDLRAAARPGGVAAELERLAALGRLSAAEAAAVDAGSLARLFGSALGARILAADELLRELPFTLLCPSALVFPDAPGEELLLQGVVDLCLREGDGLAVVDYKTDRVSGAALAARARDYMPQLRTYVYAMERLTGLPVRAAALYFLQPGEAVWLDR